METYKRIVDPLLAAIKTESSAIIAKLHREPARSADPLSDMGGSSAYVQELTEKLSFVKTEILTRLGTDGIAREWSVVFDISFIHFVSKLRLACVVTGRSTSYDTCSEPLSCTSRSSSPSTRRANSSLRAT